MTHAEMVEKIAEEFLRVRGMQPPEDLGTQMWADARAHVSDTATAAARAGYVLVPLEATEEMIRYMAAAIDYPSVYMGGASQNNLRKAPKVYAAALAARPGQEKKDV